jgi:DNA repair protein RadC
MANSTTSKRRESAALLTPETCALEAAEMLVAAYRTGKRRGASVDWSDLDVAHQVARSALLAERKRCRQSKRSMSPSALSTDGDPSGNREALPRARVRLSLVRQPGEPYSQTLRDPAAVYRLLKHEAATWDREKFLTVMLDTSNRLLGIDEVSVGTLDSAPVHPREVFKALILANAAAFISVHNHPSGDPTPSNADIAITERLQSAGKLMGIPLLDHLILGVDSYRACSQLPAWQS